MYTDYFKGSKNPKNVVDLAKYHIGFMKEHPDYFKPEGLLTFCGGQGSGKTLSAVQYVLQVLHDYPKCILCTNTKINDLPEHTKVIPYSGINCLTSINNGEYGVLYFIDELHLQFNSLESKDIPIEVMIEISQQRKQRKHIVGTTQVYGRLAKPLREQLRWVVLCSNLFKVLQINTLVDGNKSTEVDGKIVTETSKKFFWFHSPTLYDKYDTYEKMKRYEKSFKGNRYSGGYNNA